MESVYITIGAVAGVVLGAFGASALSGAGGAESLLTMMMGAIPGTVIGGWVASKFVYRDD